MTSSKKRNRRIVAIVVLLTAITFIAAIYLNRINYAGPFAICSTHEQVFEEGMQMIAQTPTGKNINLALNDSGSCFSTPGIFAKQISMKVQAGSAYVPEDCFLIHNNDTFFLDKNAWKKHSNSFTFDLTFKPPLSMCERLMAFRYWPVSFLAKGAAFLVGTLLLFIGLGLALNFFNKWRKNKHVPETNAKSRYIYLYRFLFALLWGSILFITYNLISTNSYGATLILLMYTAAFLTLTGILWTVLFVFKKAHKLNRIMPYLFAIWVSIVFFELMLRYLEINQTYFEKTYGVMNTGVYKNSINAKRVLTFAPNSEISHSYSEFEYYRKIFNEGFTDSLPVAPKREGEKRILALGDSFTEGVGAPSDSTWPALLEQMLNHAQDSLNYLVFNAGVSGSDPALQYVLLTETLASFAPDRVMLMLNESDVFDYIVRGGFERTASDYNPAQAQREQWWEWLFNTAYIVRFVMINLAGYNHLLIPESHMHEETHSALQSIYYTLEQFEAYCNNNQISLTVILMPAPHELSTGQTHVLMPLAGNLNAAGIEVIDLFPIMHSAISKKTTSLQTLYWKNDGHCTGHGYAFTAHSIHKLLTTK